MPPMVDCTNAWTLRGGSTGEECDLRRDRWEQFAPMPTPRHGLGAVGIGTTIYVAGGGPVVGEGVQSAVHEAFAVG